MRPEVAPVLRWAGSKRRLLPLLLPYFPGDFGTYFEPFLGGGAVFFRLRPHRAVLGDLCVPLVSTYEAVRDYPEDILDTLVGLRPTDREEYYRVRAAAPDDPVSAAVRFIYLNKACWNGLYRVNSSGEFNVPFGRPKSDFLVDPENLRACARALAGGAVKLAAGDFADTLRTAEAGDFAYLDPPYVTSCRGNGFREYNDRLFSWADQVRLAHMAQDLVDRGVHVVVSNAAHDSIAELYSSFAKVHLERSSTLAGKPSARRRVIEALYVAGPAGVLP